MVLQAGSSPGPGTMNDEKNNSSYLDGDVADVITGKPHDFRVGSREFRVYPVTLGKILILRPYMEASGMDHVVKTPNLYLSMLKLVRDKKELCATILAIHTIKNSREAFYDLPEIKWRTDFFFKELDDKDMASLLVVILANDRTRQIAEYLELDKEQERISAAIEAKEGKHNNLSFGGKSIFGSFIVPLKEMGFSIDEIIFECGYCFLRLILMDRQFSIYMSDDEIQRMGGSAGALIDSADANADLQLEAFFASRGVTVK